MKTFSRAMSQGDKSTDVLHKENYSHNCKLEETFCTARTTARERESRAQKRAGLGIPDSWFHKCMPETIKFPQGEQSHCESNCCSRETLLKMCAEHHCLLGSRCLDELRIASAHSYPTLTYISTNLSGLSAARSTCET